MASSAPLLREDWSGLIPHAGAMCLLDVVHSWDESRLVASSDGLFRESHPLRGAQGLHAMLLAEYGAQAMAVHAALEHRSRGTSAPPGWLVSLRDVSLLVEYVDGKRLDVRVERLYADGFGGQYAFRVEAAQCLLVEGRAAVLHRK